MFPTRPSAELRDARDCPLDDTGLPGAICRMLCAEDLRLAFGWRLRELADALACCLYVLGVTRLLIHEALSLGTLQKGLSALCIAVLAGVVPESNSTR